jgi:hypothetical protein
MKYNIGDIVKASWNGQDKIGIILNIGEQYNEGGTIDRSYQIIFAGIEGKKYYIYEEFIKEKI